MEFTRTYEVVVQGAKTMYRKSATSDLLGLWKTDLENGVWSKTLSST